MAAEFEEVGFNLCYAIQNGISDGPNYPKAYIQTNGAFVIECTEKISEYQALAKAFPELCKKHGINKLAGAETYCSYQETEKDSEKVSKFTFNISPEDFHNLLMLECERYAGYRNKADLGGSVLLLANPMLGAHKDGVICAFPVLPMENNEVMLRNAGCNVTELMSTQLTYLVSKYLPPEAYGNKTGRYGHWHSEMTQGLTNDHEAFLTVAMRCISDTDQDYYVQEMEGVDVVSLRPEAEKWLQDIDKTSENIYSLLGAGSKQELANLKSLEIPVEIYLKQLLAELERRLIANSAYKSICEGLEKNINNVKTLLENLKNNKQLDTSKSQQSGPKVGFFQGSEGKQEVDQPPPGPPGPAPQQ